MHQAKHGLVISAEPLERPLLAVTESQQIAFRTISWRQAARWQAEASRASCTVEPLAAPQVVIGMLPRRETPDASDRQRVAEMTARLHAWAGFLNEACEVAVLVQFSGGRFGSGDDANHWECGSAAAFAKSVHLETPRRRIRVLDFPPSTLVEQIDRRLQEMLESEQPFLSVGFAAEGRQRVPSARIADPGDWPARPIDWSRDDVLLVTGGGKGVTAECAFALARQTGVRCALTGRSEAKQDSEVRRTLARFKDADLNAEWFSCDVTQSDQVAALADNVAIRMGAVTGILHGAGQNIPRRVENVGVDDALDEIAAKVHGALHLREHIPIASLKLIVGLTSTIGVTGMPGNAWYAFSNELLHALFRDWQRTPPHVEVQAIAFGLWDEVGMGAKLGVAERLAEQGIGGISNAEGTRRFVDLCLRDPGRSQVAVAARMGNLATWPSKTVEPSGMRFLDGLMLFERGVEVLASTKLHPDRDAYLADHNFHGSLLFPTVFGLEAMAQAATFVLDQPTSPIMRIEDVTLDRPITVDPQQGTLIEIHAVVRESPIAGRQVVDVTIRTDQTGFTKNHFRATIVFGQRQVAAQVAGPAMIASTRNSDRSMSEAPLKIAAATDLYGSVLFQGPMFQRIQQIRELDTEHVVFQSYEATPAGSIFPDHKDSDSRLVLGDPFFRDVLLQAGQLTIPQEQCLPIRIDCIEFFAGAGECVGERVVAAPWKVREGDQYRAEIYSQNLAGEMQERFSGYRLQILSSRDDLPAVADLLNPQRRDRALLADLLEMHAIDDSPAPFGVAYLSDRQLHSLDQTERRARVTSVVEQAARDYLGIPTTKSCPMELSWRPNGRPVMTLDRSQRHVSVAHDDYGCLCVVGNSMQGVDLEPLQHRTQEEWSVLFAERHREMLAMMQNAGDSVDIAGARLWCSLESFRKATGQSPDAVVLAQRIGDALTMSMTAEMDAKQVRLDVVSSPIRFTLGPPRVVAWVQHCDGADSRHPKSEKKSLAQSPSVAGGIPEDWHCVRVAADGPEGQPVQEMRMVVSFQDASTASRRVPAARYMSWMGRIRELVTSANVPALVPLIQSGDWGLVTNWGELQILDELAANDVVQLRFWTEPPTRSNVVFTCEFHRVAENGLHRVAVARQRATWVKIIGHGRVQPSPFPEDLAQFISQMGPQYSSPRVGESGGPFAFADFFDLVANEDAEQFDDPPVMLEDVRRTTFEESNLVGNIYFANYFHWQHRLLDLFVHQQEATEPAAAASEWLTLSSRVDYLREAMPFDRIAVAMSLKQLGDRSLVLGFEYFRVADDGERQKLAVGEQVAVRILRQDQPPHAATRVPATVREGLLYARHRE